MNSCVKDALETIKRVLSLGALDEQEQSEHPNKRLCSLTTSSYKENSVRDDQMCKLKKIEDNNETKKVEMIEIFLELSTQLRGLLSHSQAKYAACKYLSMNQSMLAKRKNYVMETQNVNPMRAARVESHIDGFDFIKMIYLTGITLL